MAKARRIRGLTASNRFGDAAATVVRVRAAEVFAYADGVLDTTDIDPVHDMRVATRRLRAALEVFAPCFPADLHAELLGEVKDLADALGERRDPDVAIEWLGGFEDVVAPADLAGVAGFVAAERDRQTLGNLEVEAALRRVRDGQLEQRLLELAELARDGGAEAGAEA